VTNFGDSIYFWNGLFKVGGYRLNDQIVGFPHWIDGGKYFDVIQIEGIGNTE
jgi:hypothetical protein